MFEFNISMKKVWLIVYILTIIVSAAFVHYHMGKFGDCVFNDSLESIYNLVESGISLIFWVLVLFFSTTSTFKYIEK
jgi:hypothetical protein